MSTLHVSDIPMQHSSPDRPADLLRRTAAAVRVHFTWWGVKKSLTPEQKDQAASSFDAEGGYMSASKKLVDTKAPKFKALTSIKGRIGHYWNGKSLPYVEPGMRLIKQSDIEGFIHTMQQYREELREAERELDQVFDELRHDARRRLGRLYNAADYPPMIRDLFLVEWDFPSVEPPSYLLQLNPAIYEQERQRVAARFEQAVQLAEQGFAREFGEMVAKLAERLQPNADGTPKQFKASSITNLTEFFNRFGELNLHSNADLDNMVQQAQQLVQGISPDDLRSQASVRADVAQQMARISEQLEGMIVDQPRRRIIRSQD